MTVASLVTFDAPAGWTAEVHEDGAGADITDGDLHIRVTLMPASMFEAVGVELPAPAHAEDLGEMLGSMLSPLGAAASTKAAVLALQGVDIWSATANDAETSSTVFAFVAEPGVVVIATASSSADSFDENAARSVVGSIRVTASSADVAAAINPPPSPDFPTI